VDVAALREWKSLYSRDGLIPPSTFEAVKAVSALSLERVRPAPIEPATVYTNEFVTKTL
jgi:hypothetical protein